MQIVSKLVQTMAGTIFFVPKNPVLRCIVIDGTKQVCNCADYFGFYSCTTWPNPLIWRSCVFCWARALVRPDRLFPGARQDMCALKILRCLRPPTASP